MKQIELAQPLAIDETEKAMCFVYANGYLKERYIWVPKSILKITDDSIWTRYFVPFWFVKNNRLWQYTS